jgi:hypothetical protein
MVKTDLLADDIRNNRDMVRGGTGVSPVNSDRESPPFTPKMAIVCTGFAACAAHCPRPAGPLTRKVPAQAMATLSDGNRGRAPGRSSREAVRWPNGGAGGRQGRKDHSRPSGHPGEASSSCPVRSRTGAPRESSRGISYRGCFPSSRVVWGRPPHGGRGSRCIDRTGPGRARSLFRLAHHGIPYSPSPTFEVWSGRRNGDRGRKCTPRRQPARAERSLLFLPSRNPRGTRSRRFSGPSA